MSAEQTPKSCCTPGRRDSQKSSLTTPAEHISSTSLAVPEIPVVSLSASKGLLGTDQPIFQLDEEAPCRTTKLNPYLIMSTTVTNQMFAAFVAATNYVTEAEQYGWSFVFYRHMHEDYDEKPFHAGTPWWSKVEGAHWRLVNGPTSEDSYFEDHPVVHVSWNDACAFAKWVGGRLPTEAEWEHAARGGMGAVTFPWGEREPNDHSFLPCNIWQGDFPKHDIAADGYAATAPAKSYEPNGYGMYNMCGNVWEWTSQAYRVRSVSKKYRQQAKRMRGTKVLKGGSYLCHKSYCFRYRIAARTFSTPDSTTGHQGFRVVFDQSAARNP